MATFIFIVASKFILHICYDYAQVEENYFHAGTDKIGLIHNFKQGKLFIQMHKLDESQESILFQKKLFFLLKNYF